MREARATSQEKALRGVIRALQKEFNVSDERIKQLYTSLLEMGEEDGLDVIMSTERPSQTQQCLLLDSLSEDVLGEIIAFLDVFTNLQLRRVCKRLHAFSLSSFTLKYWQQCWMRFKGVETAPKCTSSAQWERECRWAGLIPSRAPIVTTLSGHRGSVTALAFVPSSNGKRELLVSGSDDGSLVVWSCNNNNDAASTRFGMGGGEEEMIMQQHHRQTKENSVARLHSLNGHHGPVWAVSVNDAGQVASGSFDMTVKLWDLASGNCTQTLRGHENWVSCVHLGSDGVVVSGSYDSMIKAWNAQTSRAENLPTDLAVTNNAVYALDRADNFIVAGSLLSRFEVFDLTANALVRRFPGAHLAKTWAVQFQSSHLVGTGGCDGRVKTWDLRQPSATPIVNVQAHNQAVLGLRLGAWETAPHRLVTCSADHLVKVFDMRMCRPANSTLFESYTRVVRGGKGGFAPHRPQHSLSLHSAAVFCLGLTEDKITSGSADGTIKVVRFART